MRRRWTRLAVTATALVLAACGPATLVRVSPQSLSEALQAREAHAAHGAELSRYTRELLARTADAPVPATPVGRFGQVARASTVPAADRALALAELALQSALELAPAAPDAARDRFLLAAAFADESLRDLAGGAAAAFDGRVPVARTLYETATARFLLAWRATRASDEPLVVKVGGRRFHVETAAHGDTRRLLAAFPEIELAWTLGIEGLASRHQREGVGVPLVGWRTAPAEDPAWRFGPHGAAAPLTALLRFEDEGETEIVHLELHDARRHDAVDLHGRRVPLAADFSAPLALAWARSRGAALGHEGIRDAAAVERYRGFRLLEPYDPRRTPVVLVHGLRSSEQAWRNLANEIHGSPRMRERYQVWLYFYPTAEPFLVTAQRFRADLDALLADLNAPADPGLVVVGHSMGGLLAKTLAVDTGRRLWDAAFTVGPDDLRVDSPQDRLALQRLLIFERHPAVARVVFVATPHGGSALADAWWARVAERFIRLPASLTDRLAAAFRTDESQVRPAMRRWFAEGRATSIDSLSPRQALLRAFRELPLAPGILAHSVYGTAVGAGETLGDGVVRAVDARHPGAVSEFAAPLRHGDFDTPPALDELIRILDQHAATRGAHPVASPRVGA